MTKHPTRENSAHSIHLADGADPEERRQAIAARAYQLYLDSGSKDGQEEENWFKAEQQLLDEQRQITSSRPDNGEPIRQASTGELADFVTLQ